ncbi:MAG: stage III sporulation protein AA [Clostridium sp.]
MYDEVFRVFPAKLFGLLKEFKELKDIHEIRMKIGKPIIFSMNNGEKIIEYKVTSEDLKETLQRISNYSLYAYEEDIKQGFITLKGGHRIGLAGECVIDGGRIKTIRNISSLNIRICREVIGCSNKLMEELVKGNRVFNTLIISPPKCGKTTLLRDISRNLSNGVKKISLQGKKVVIVDERSEIGGSYLGVPQMDIGIRTDILDNCPKSEGMILSIRSLSPEVLICDEIGSKQDLDALNMAFNSGVNIVVTVHGNDIEDIYKREGFRDLISSGILDKVVVLSNRCGVGTIENVYNLKEVIV